MHCTVKTVYDLIDCLAPFSLACEWDNVGLLCGDFSAGVRCILTALDICGPVLEEAERINAQCIVTHHPIMFRPIQKLNSESHDGILVRRLVKSGISHIAAHTNLDIADGGVNDALVEKLGLSADSKKEHMRFGSIAAISLEDINRLVGEKLHCDSRAFGERSRLIRRFAVSSGSAGWDEIHEALLNGADLLITGEMKYHDQLCALDFGLGLICAGHAATEQCAVEVLANHLQKEINALQFNVQVFQSCVSGYKCIR